MKSKKHIIWLLIFLPQLLLAQYTKQYTYDKLNRLQQIKFNNAPVVSYIYDELGNRTAKTVNESGFTISPKQLVVAALANSKATFAINSSLAWSITSNQSWLSANTGSGNGNATITLTASANTGSDSRPALVIVSATGFKPDTVRVTQAGTTNLLTASPSALSLLSASESAAKFTVSSNIAWSVVCSESWLTLSQTSGFNNSEITVSANSANTGSTNRSATITVSGTGVSSQTITVTQAGSPFQPTLFLSANSVIFGPSNVSTATLTLTSNMNWTATSNESWLTFNPSSGIGNSAFTLTASENSTQAIRQASITILADGIAPQIIQVIQEAGLPGIFTQAYLNLKIKQGEQFLFFIDYNNDGLKDFLTQENTTGILHFYKDNGTGYINEFDLQANPYSFSAWPSSKLYGLEQNFYTDFDGDGQRDLLVYSANHSNCSSNSVTIYWGLATAPYFNAEVKTNFSINSPFCVGAYGVDFNNDGLFDVFIRSASGINTMFRNDGNRNFTLVSTYNTGRDIGVNFNDYDGDGIQDLTYTKNGWADGQWGFRFNKGLGDGNFSSSTLISNSQQRPVDDFIQLQANPKINSIPDVIYNCMNDGSNGAILYQGEWNSSSSSFDITTWNSNLTGQVTLINTIDINFDGYSDLVFDQQNGSEPNLTHTSVVFLNNGEGIFTISDEIFTDKTYALRAVFNDGQDHIKMATWKSDSLFVFNLDQYKKLDLNSGLLAYYPFNGNANDESGNENNGVVEGQTSFQPGKVGMAASFRGKSVGDYISVPQNNVNSLSEITVSNWVYVNDYDLNCWNSAEGFITRGDPNANNFFSFGVLRNEEPNCGAASSLDSIGFRLIFSNSVYLDTKKSYKPNVWYHVVGTYDGKNLRIYVDNQPAAESPEITGIQLIGNSRLLINKHEIYSNGRMGGLIDELRLYNRALNLSEIDSLYKQGVSINQPPTANAGPDGDVWIVYPETQKTVYLDGSASVDPDGDELTYRWTAPEGVILSSNSIAMPSFVANFENSPYTFSLIVNDGKQDSPADLVVIRAIQVIRANSPTVAKAGPDQVVTGGTVVTLDGSASFDYDEDGYPNPLTYSWTAPEGITLSSTTSIKPTFTAPNVASTTSLFFTLQVSDGGSSNTDTVVVTLLGNDILGISVVYGLASTAPNRRAIPVTFNENGEINSISVYHNGGSGNMLLGVYADVAGKPASRLGMTSSVAVNSVEGWQTVALASPVSVSSGQKVWLSFVFQNSVAVRYEAGTPGRAMSSQTWPAGMPDNFGTSGVSNYNFSVYCNYTPVEVNEKPLGNNVVYNTTSTAANRRAIPVTFNENGEINSISVYHNGGSGNMLLGVYTDVAGKPASRLGVTSLVAVNAAEGWQTVALANPVSVSSGQKVWLSFVFQNSVAVRYEAGTPGRAMSSQTWSAGIPDNFGTSGVSNYNFSVYCNYTPVEINEKPLGNTVVYSITSTAANRRAIPVTFNEDGTINSISVYHNGGSGNMLLGVYTDVAGKPASRLGVTSSVAVNAAEGWQTVALANPVSVSSGQKVWLSFVFQNSVAVRYEAGTPGRAMSSQTWTAGMPDNFGTSGVSNYNFSVYCSYTPVEISEKPLGNTVVYSTTSTAANRRAIPVTFNENGEINSISVYHNGGSGNMLLGVYTDVAGKPASRLGVTSSVAVNAAEGWQTVALANPVSVSSGQKVWLSFVFQNSVAVRYEAGTPGRAMSSQTWSAGMPDNFGTSGVSNYNFSVYCNYTPVEVNEKPLGNTVVYSTTSTAANRRAIPVTFNENGEINSISVYHNGGSGNMLLGVYTDVAGKPASRLGVTSSVAVNAAEGWQTVALANPVSVSSGQKVWLSFVFQNSVAVRYEAGTPGRAMSSQTWSAGMPTDFGSSGVSNYNFSVYCNYTSASSGLSKSGQYDNKITETIENPIGEANELKVYPNPFRQKLNFEFVSAQNANAILEIYNLNGQLIAKLLDQQVQGGVLNRIEYEPNEIISGMYIYKLNLDGNISVGKVIYRK